MILFKNVSSQSMTINQDAKLLTPIAQLDDSQVEGVFVNSKPGVTRYSDLNTVPCVKSSKLQ